jgi:hypothetical protein
MTSTTDIAAGPSVSDDQLAALSHVGPTPTLASPPLTTAQVGWSLTTRTGFRFAAVYCGLYVLSTQMFGGLLGGVLSLLPFRVTPPMLWGSMRTFQSHIAVNGLGFPEPLALNTGAGDKPIDYALALGLLVIASAVTAIWSAVDWRRRSYPRLHAWFRLFLRLSVATSLAGYGWAKVFPLQMPFPPLSRLLEPYGHFSLMAVLWSKIGASPAYEIFTGVAELAAAVLLMIPGITSVGALVSMAVTFQIFVLNMTYDVPVKLFSLHLLVMSTILLLPDVRRLFTFLVLKRAIDPPRDGRLFANAAWHRVAVAVQVVFAAWSLWMGYQGGKAGSAQRAVPKPPLYGIWNIDRMTIDGVERAPLLTDYDRWRRIVVQYPNSIQFQRMNDTWAGFSAVTDLAAKTLVVSTLVSPQAAMANPASADRKEAGRFTLDQPAPDKLILDGTVNGKRLRMETSHFDPGRFRLASADFKWVQDRPWNISNADYVSQFLR